jgi:hypothetical protein
MQDLCAGAAYAFRWHLSYGAFMYELSYLATCDGYFNILDAIGINPNSVGAYFEKLSC